MEDPLLPVTNHIQKKFVLTSSTGTGSPLLADKSLQFLNNSSSHSSLGNDDQWTDWTPNSVKPRWMWQTHPPPQAHWQNFSSLSGRACYHQAELFSSIKGGLCWIEPGIPKLSAFGSHSTETLISGVTCSWGVALLGTVNSPYTPTFKDELKVHGQCCPVIQVSPIINMYNWWICIYTYALWLPGYRSQSSNGKKM